MGMEENRNIHDMICVIENGFSNQWGILSNIKTKMLSKEKKRAIPWYRFSFMDDHHEKYSKNTDPTIMYMSVESERSIEKILPFNRIRRHSVPFFE